MLITVVRPSACTCTAIRHRSRRTSWRGSASTSSASTAASASTRAGLRVYTTLDPKAQRAAVRALRDGLRAVDRRARGFVRPEASVVGPDGLLPEPLHLDEWDWPFAVGDVVRGVVLASDRASAVVQVGEYRGRLLAADVAWTRRTSLADVLPRGAVAPFRIEALSDARGRRGARLLREQEPKVEGALLALDVRTGAVRAMVGGYDFELSHLYYVGLENPGAYKPDGTENDPYGLINLDPFVTLWESYYWSDNEVSPGSNYARAFYFGQGFQVSQKKGYNCVSIAVYDGRVSAPVPEPATMLLLASGLVGLAGFRKLRKL